VTSTEASVDVSLSVADKVKSLSNEPPVNIQLVNEIRQKVSEGRYPIDLNAISSKMFESIKNG
jgi:flagellar biosynthesis anti-sigma factor FlgM